MTTACFPRLVVCIHVLHSVTHTHAHTHTHTQLHLLLRVSLLMVLQPLPWRSVGCHLVTMEGDLLIDTSCRLVRMALCSSPSHSPLVVTIVVICFEAAAVSSLSWKRTLHTGMCVGFSVMVAHSHTNICMQGEIGCCEQ